MAKTKLAKKMDMDRAVIDKIGAEAEMVRSIARLNNAQVREVDARIREIEAHIQSQAALTQAQIDRNNQEHEGVSTLPRQ